MGRNDPHLHIWYIYENPRKIRSNIHELISYQCSHASIGGRVFLNNIPIILFVLWDKNMTIQCIQLLKNVPFLSIQIFQIISCVITQGYFCTGYYQNGSSPEEPLLWICGEEFMERTREFETILFLFLPDTTIITQKIDNLFLTFKRASNKNTKYFANGTIFNNQVA